MRGDIMLDLRSLSCPFVLSELVNNLGERDEVEFLCDHPTTISDSLPKFCEFHGYELQMNPEIYPINGNAYRVKVSK